MAALPPRSRWTPTLALAAAVIGVAALAFAFFGPTYSVEVCTTSAGGVPPVCESSTESLYDQGIEAGTWAFGAMVLVALAVAVVAALAWYRGGRPVARRALWSATAVMAAAVVIAMASIGIAIIPSTLLLAASAMATGQRRVTAVSARSR